MIIILLATVLSLSYNCDYPEFGPLSSTHYLYKEEVLAEVKWLESYEYCRAKGDGSVYADAGKPKCEYSRGLCYWNNGCERTFRQKDTFSDCQNLLNDNVLVQGLDNGRLQKPQPQPQFEQPKEYEQISELTPEDLKVSSASTYPNLLNIVYLNL